MSHVGGRGAGDAGLFRPILFSDGNAARCRRHAVCAFRRARKTFQGANA
jgi:hypothetical protein